jgi:hypothetical protein
MFIEYEIHIKHVWGTIQQFNMIATLFDRSDDVCGSPAYGPFGLETSLTRFFRSANLNMNKKVAGLPLKLKSVLRGLEAIPRRTG